MLQCCNRAIWKQRGVQVFVSRKKTVMKKTIFKGITIGITTVALTVAGVAGYKAMNPKSADVVAVTEVTKTVEIPLKECRDVQRRAGTAASADF